MPPSPPEISDAPPLATAPGVARGAAGASSEPLQDLYKMSTTAGVGSGEYVAINGTAIAAVLLGVASTFALVNPVILVIPLAALVCGVMALRQIGESNGTQTGRPLAWVGIVLATAFGGYMAVSEGTETMRTRADRQAIEGLMAKLGDDVRAGNAGAAYDQLGERFRAQVARQLFVDRMGSARSSPLFGNLVRIESNSLASFDTDANGVRTAVATSLFRFDKVDEPMRQTMTFRKVGDAWEIDAMPDLFPPPAPPQPGGPGGPPPQGLPGGIEGPPAPQ